MIIRPIKKSLKSLYFSIEGIAPFDKKICELQKLYLAPKEQGLGISKQLMETALFFAKTYYDTCYLETNHTFKTAGI
ncbi:GNAT family N-acetyltransferase [Leuconostoc suionicum]|uniref:GNAT family N-acetyltransferase n=1 Tax=Leuconostoc suionicum TaxID=1511761 RepID=UPI00233F09CF|nr:GNAT family N-acetyltransferase [Leuconostoc suionicum]MDC2806251.1 GNAT family N-acetyltransferase [Leuconostoc suionicum]MDC2823763.1 GNAT family N-acetyltransferase [Leuconostoc suionicum]